MGKKYFDGNWNNGVDDMIKPFLEKRPTIAPEVWVAENAVVVGGVTLHPKSSVWYGAVLRGDDSTITIGAGSNIQDLTMVHCSQKCPTVVGKGVTVGHGVILHGCTIEDDALIGMGSILLNGCVIGAGAIIGAGSLVTQGTVIPPKMLAMGSPAKVVRPVKPEEYEDNLHSALDYQKLAQIELRKNERE